MIDPLPRYDTSQTYRWNYEHAPMPVSVGVAPVAGEWEFCGLPVDSPLGISAGPLLNGRWCVYYSRLGFDVLTYKTVRSRQRDCYPLPNLQPVTCERLVGEERRVAPADEMRGTWAVSFGMPSSDPEIWRRDVEWTRRHLPAGKVLCVSVVGTMQPGWTMQQLADDYAKCARWAIESGADCIETNFSCPNVSSCDGQLYQHPEHCRLVAATVRSAIGSAPLIIKIGHLACTLETAALLDAIGDFASGLAMTNSIAAVVGESDDELMFQGQQRGICGNAIRDASVAQVKRFSEAVQCADYDIKLIGVGGIRTAEHVREYLQAGAQSCHLATTPMVDPTAGLKIRERL